MGASGTERHDDWVQALYASVLEGDAEEFGRDRLRGLSQRVPFGLALWETRETGGELIQRRSARGTPMQTLLSVETLAAQSARVAQVEVEIAADPLQHRLWFVRDLDAPFSATERQTLASLSRHLVAAEALCQRALLSPARQTQDIAARSNEREASPRELEIARLVATGKTLKQTGAELGLAVGTVSSHLYNLQARIGRKTRAELGEWLATQPATAAPFKQWLDKELKQSFRLQPGGKTKRS